MQRMHWMCTMCDRYKAAAARPGPFRGCGSTRCWSPIAGGWFPEYQGPLRVGGDHAHAWCFMCGERAQAAVVVRGHRLGVCPFHVNHLRTRVRRAGGDVREVYGRDREGLWACLDAESGDERHGEHGADAGDGAVEVRP